MQSELKSLSKIFSESIFRIPDYQRGYSWGPKQLKDFWSDIQQLPPEKDHYTGVLTLEPVSPESFALWEDDIWIIESKRYAPLYVVDGQQRLTTAVILIQSILDVLNDDDSLNYTKKSEIQKKYVFESKDGGISRSYLFGYERDNPSYEYLKQEIYREQSDLHHAYEETIYTNNLRDAKHYFDEKISNLDRLQIERTFSTLTQKLLFNIFYIEKTLDVFVTFETMNNRGKLLSHLELLKNRLIYLSTKVSADQSEREKLRRSINEAWKKIYHFLGKARSKTFDDDTFLKTHFICFFGPKLLEKQKLLEEQSKAYLDNSTIESSTNDDSDLSDVDTGIDETIVFDDEYKDQLLEEIFSPKKLGDVSDQGVQELGLKEIYEYVTNIQSTVKTYFYTLAPEASPYSETEKELIARIMRLGEYKHYILCFSALLRSKEGKNREAFLAEIERMSFFAKIRRYSFLEVKCVDFAIKICGGLKSIDAACDEIRKVTEKVCGSKDFVEALRSIGKDSGYYGWPPIRYVMFEYEQQLRRASKSARQLLTWVDHFHYNPYDTDHKTIEHIFPQRAADSSWREKFSKYSVKEKNILKNAIGNLLPVSHAKNASLSNKSFADKKGSAENGVGYSYGCLSEIQVAHHAEWGALEILNRSLDLLEFMENRWAFKLGALSDKVEVLRLGFVLKREKLDIIDLETSRKAMSPKKRTNRV